MQCTVPFEMRHRTYRGLLTLLLSLKAYAMP